MKKLINISIFSIALIAPSYFLAMQQSTSLKEKAASITGEFIDKEGLEKLKEEEYPLEIYNLIAKKALPNIVKSTKANNIWEAVAEIKRLSNDTLNSDTELAGQLINELADRYTADFSRLYAMAQQPGTSWDQMHQWAGYYTFLEYTYIDFAAKVLNTPGAKEWLKQHPQKNVIYLNRDYTNKPQ